MELKQLLINMGGVDSNNVTEKILEKLKICNLLDDLHIVIVMGGASPNIQKVKAKIATLPFKVEIKVDVDNMAEIMANSDIAIGASGSTTWERCCLGIPTIQLIIAHNQEFVAQQLSKINAIRLVELDDLVENLENFQYWMREVSENAKNITNGDGTKSVLEHLL